MYVLVTPSFRYLTFDRLCWIHEHVDYLSHACPICTSVTANERPTSCDYHMLIFGEI